MTQSRFDRRTFLAGAAGITSLRLLPAHFPTLPENDFQALPARSIWSPDVKSVGDTESCFFFLVRRGLPSPKPLTCTVESFAKGQLLRTVQLTPELLAAFTFEIKPKDSTYYFLRVTEPMKLNVDQIRVTMQYESGKSGFDLKPERYECKTKLIFPFVGPAMISQG